MKKTYFVFYRCIKEETFKNEFKKDIAYWDVWIGSYGRNSSFTLSNARHG